MLTIKYDDGGVSRSLDLMADSFAELGPVFRPFAKYMRKEVQAVFDSGGEGEWAPRTAESQAQYDETKAARIKKIEAGKYTSLIGSLRSSQKKVQRRIDRNPGGDSKLTARREKSIARYESQVAEVQRVAAGGAHNPAGQKKLYERIGRRDERAAKKIQAVESGALLGSIANSFRITWDKSSWTMASEIPWAGAHNDGATVGHGATLPRRRFLEWTPERLAKFVEFANAHVLRAFEKSGDK